MAEKSNTVLHAALIILLGTLGSILIGYALKGNRIFVVSDPGVQYIIYGLSGAILLAVLVISNHKTFLVTIPGLLLAHIIIFKITNVPIIAVRLFYLVALAGAIYIFFSVCQNYLQKLKFGKFLILGVLLGVFDLIVLFVLLKVAGQFPDENAMVLGQAFIGFITGCGIGIGYELSTPAYRVLKL